MKRKLFFISALALIMAGGIFWACQKEDITVNSEDGLRLKAGVTIQSNFVYDDDVDCDVDCIQPEGPYFVKTYKQYYDEVADKWVQVDVYNTATDIVYEITSSADIIEVWDNDEDTLMYFVATYNPGGNINGGVPATQPFIITREIGEYGTDWEECNEVAASIRVTRKYEANAAAVGNSQTFNTSYFLIGVCQGCEESFSYETMDNTNVVFTYESDVEILNAVVKLTCPHVDLPLNGEGKFVGNDEKVYEVNNTGSQTVLSWTGDILECEPVTFDVTLVPDCEQNSAGFATVWTDFKVNEISKKSVTPPAEGADCRQELAEGTTDQYEEVCYWPIIKYTCPSE